MKRSIALLAMVFMVGCSQPPDDEDFTHAFQAFDHINRWVAGDDVVSSRAFDCPEDGELRLLVNVEGQKIFVEPQFRNTSGFFAGDWDGYSISALAIDVQHGPEGAISFLSRQVSAPDLFSGDCAFDWEDPGDGPVYCAYAWNFWELGDPITGEGARTTRIGASILDLSDKGVDGAKVLIEDEWYSLGVIEYLIEPGYKGPIYFSTGRTVDDLNCLEAGEVFITLRGPSRSSAAF